MQTASQIPETGFVRIRQILSVTLHLSKRESIDVDWFKNPDGYWIAVAIYCFLGLVGLAYGLYQVFKDEK